MIADELFATYRECYRLGPQDVEVGMRDTYQFHVDTFTDSLNNGDGHNAGDGNDDEVPN